MINAIHFVHCSSLKLLQYAPGVGSSLSQDSGGDDDDEMPQFKTDSEATARQRIEEQSGRPTDGTAAGGRSIAERDLQL